jgi:hypothetical protein
MVEQFKHNAIVGYALFSSRVVELVVWEGNRVAIDELQGRGPVTERIVENQGGSDSEGQRPKLITMTAAPKQSSHQRPKDEMGPPNFGSSFRVYVISGQSS